MASEIESLFREVLVYVGDLNRMDIRLSYLRNKAKELGVTVEDFPSCDKTIERLDHEANALHDGVDENLDT